MGDVAFTPCLVRSGEGAGGGLIRVGHPVLNAYLELVAARARPKAVLAQAYDLKVFFSVIDKEPAEVVPADVLVFIAEQRKPRQASNVVRIEDGEAGLSSRTIKRRLATIAGRLVADWWEACQEGTAVMIAARKADVTDLNDKARAILKADGILAEIELTIAGRSFAAGDEVMTLRNDRRLGVINGSRGVVESIDAGAGQLEVRLDNDSLVALPTDYLQAGHVTHAYAITGHKAQGMTTDRALVLGDESLYREWGYVAMSRGREENRLYVVMGDGCGREEVGGAVERPYAVDELVRSLERSRAKSMAFDPDGDIAQADSASLRAEQRGIYEQLSAGPRDQTRELTQLRKEHERTNESLLRERELAHKYLAIDVQLGLSPRGVADAHRPAVAPPLEMGSSRSVRSISPPTPYMI